jgi:hypothetical protein
MNIDLGWLGKVVMCQWEEEEHFVPNGEGFIIVSDGYTDSGIRVHGVLDNRPHITYPYCWQNAILIKL